MPVSDPHQSQPNAPRRFASTRWSLVAQAAGTDPALAHQALTTLCQIYWYPIYAYARHQVPRADDAQDMTQAFFAQLLEKDYIGAADRTRGRFRSFLRTAFDHFLSKERERAGAQKRGGGRPLFPLDFESGEHRFSREPADHATPERLFERRWALTLLEQALARLRDELTDAGKEHVFENLKNVLAADGHAEPYAAIAQRLGMTEQAVRVAVHRLRRRYAELLRAEIALTVSSDDEIEDELQSLFKAVRRK